MSDPRDLTALWPAAGLRVRAGDLELRWIDDDLLTQLADLAARGIHDPAAMPFNVPWTRGTPAEVARSVVTYQWGARSAVGPNRLVLELGVLAGGVPVGIQGFHGPDWAVLRSGETGSWLGAEHQGRGLGTRMRALMLHLLFEGLGARVVTSTAFVDNPRSAAVSARVGYLDDGETWVVRDGEAASMHRFVMTREQWERVCSANETLLGAPVEYDGVARLREFLTST